MNCKDACSVDLWELAHIYRLPLVAGINPTIHRDDRLYNSQLSISALTLRPKDNSILGLPERPNWDY